LAIQRGLDHLELPDLGLASRAEIQVSFNDFAVDLIERAVRVCGKTIGRQVQRLR
jgi:hypothetical protein